MRLPRSSRGIFSERPVTIGNCKSSPCGRSRITPRASMRASSVPFRRNAMGVRSVKSTRMRFGRMRCTIAHKLLQHRLAADNVIAVDFNLLRLDEQHRMPVKQKASGRPRGGDSRDSYDDAKQNAPVERPAPPAEFLSADLDRLLTAQIARLFVA